MSKVTGKTFCITGVLSLNRDQVKETIINAGGEVASSCTRKVDYLIVGDKPGSKLAAAEKIGIRILTEEEFQKML